MEHRMTWKDVAEIYKEVTWGLDGNVTLNLKAWTDLATLQLRPPEWAIGWINGGYPEPPPWMLQIHKVQNLKQLHSAAEAARKKLHKVR